MRRLAVLAAAAAVAALAWQAAAQRAPSSAPAARDGAALYDRYCLACHGGAGKGNGPAAPWLWPRPRDFTTGDFKWRSTPTGQPPTLDDLRVAIREGVPGTSMHAFGASLTASQIDALARVVTGFAPRAFARSPTPIARPTPPPAATAARGEAVYEQLGCAECHGPGGRGDGPSAATLEPAPPYDLTARPLRRPGADGIDDIYLSLVTGLAGTAMPSYAGAAPDEDLWAVAAYVDAIRYRPATGPPQPEPTSVDPRAIETTDHTTAGYWPGEPDSPDAVVWGDVLSLQGPKPDVLAPAQGSLFPRQCGRCHAKQLREWRGSLHAATASPGLYGQILRVNDLAAESCQRCHAPLAEQLPRARGAHRGAPTEGFADNPRYDASLRDESIACAACHVRDWRRYGPPVVAAAKLLDQPNYPLTELPIYERSDFCLPCHQLPPRLALRIAGAETDARKRKPALNTYREWLESPYMRRGIQCQHCHMPNREHTFLGIHDPETFEQGVELEAIAGRAASGVVSVRARLTNVGAGHYLPTTPTPAVFLEAELLDADERGIEGAREVLRIGRHLGPAPDGKFAELEDTRIPPGESIELARGWKGGRVADARYARIRVRVHPDEHYEHLFTARLRRKLAPDVRAYFEQALGITRDSKYLALERLIPIE